jgi:hypothetical protein
MSQRILKLAELNKQDHLIHTLYTFENFESDSKGKIGRLAFLPEGGGKTRVIAIADYFSQSVLLPIHETLMDLLRSLETDGAYDQEAQAQRVLKNLNHESHSFDLSAATDRFPIALQKVVVSAMLGPKTAELWFGIMSDRSFSHKNNKDVKYSVGQPMGMLSS